jgi:hypothetical protein
MTTSTAVSPNDLLSQPNYALDDIELPPNPGDLSLTFQGVTVLYPSVRGFLPRVFYARQSLAVSGVIAYDRVGQPPNALFFRSDYPQGPFVRVVSQALPLPLTGGGAFTIQINNYLYPTLFPGYFLFAIRNPKNNTQPIFVVITGAVVDGISMPLGTWATVSAETEHASLEGRAATAVLPG